MSNRKELLEKAQFVVNEIHSDFGINLVTFSTSEIESLRDAVDTFLDYQIDVGSLTDPSDADSDAPKSYADEYGDYGDDEIESDLDFEEAY